MKKTFQVDENGYYGPFGGAFIPEILHKCVEELRENYLPIMESESFQKEFNLLLNDYAGRPSPLYFAPRLSERYGCKIYLKREDLNHTGAHKINNTIGQILIAQRMGKSRIIAETGAGQHGVATATVCAMKNMECIVYMGKTDVERQYTNVQKMRMLGAEVRPVTSGNMTLKDATNEAIRDWCCHPSDTHYIIGSTVGPHPYPDIVARLQSVISKEIRSQILEKEGPRLSGLPDRLRRRRKQCGGNRIPLRRRRPGSRSFWPKPAVRASPRADRQPPSSWAAWESFTDHVRWSCRTRTAKSKSPYSISAGLDYPGIGPIHANMAKEKRGACPRHKRR